MRLMPSARTLSIVALAVLTVSCGRGSSVSKDDHLTRGNKYLAEGKTAEAIVEYRSAIAQDARFGEARYRLGKAYLAANNPQAALRELVRAADLAPDNTEVQLDAARVLLTANQAQDARTRVEGVLKREPKNVTAHILRGVTLAGMRDLDRATADFEEAASLASDSSVPSLNLASAYAALG
jgi:tetratricopeptide (TPR) repeat protein